MAAFTMSLIFPLPLLFHVLPVSVTSKAQLAQAASLATTPLTTLEQVHSEVLP